jgi:hypothetical protein
MWAAPYGPEKYLGPPGGTAGSPLTIRAVTVSG